MKKILIVDDDPAIGNLLEETLTRAGYRAVRAYSGTEALLSITNTRPDLVLLDLMLPGLTGEELLPKLRLPPPPRCFSSCSTSLSNRRYIPCWR